MSVNKCGDALKKNCKQSYDDACDDHYDAYYKDYDDALLGRRQFLNALKQSKKHLRSKHGYNNDGGLMMIMVRLENGKASIVGVNDAAQDKSCKMMCVHHMLLKFSSSGIACSEKRHHQAFRG